jgi:hypothetical protein
VFECVCVCVCDALVCMWVCVGVRGCVWMCAGVWECVNVFAGGCGCAEIGWLCGCRWRGRRVQGVRGVCVWCACVCVCAECFRAEALQVRAL